jgi:hypothetical protein
MARRWIRRLVYLVAVLVLLWGAYSVAVAQTLTGEARGSVAVWAEHARCTQHAMTGEAQGTARLGVLFAEGFLSVKWWGACDAKIPSSPLNAEAGKVIERRHGVNIGVQWHGFQIGATVRRDAVHHIWRHKDRHAHFPGNWRIGRKGCNGEATPSHPAGKGCPSIGYYDGVGPFLGYDAHGVDVTITGPQYRWKTLTLPWPNWTLRAEVALEEWQFRVYGQAGGPAYPALSGQIARKLGLRLWLGVRGGRIDAPGWRRPFDRVAVVLLLK